MEDTYPEIWVNAPLEGNRFTLANETRAVQVVSIAEAARQNNALPTVTYMWAWTLTDLMRAVAAHQKLIWYPNGAENPEIKADYVIRGFTDENGNFGSSEDDLRTRYVRLSGMGERFIPVTEVIDALSNIDGHLGLDKPIATIEAR